MCARALSARSDTSATCTTRIIRVAPAAQQHLGACECCRRGGIAGQHTLFVFAVVGGSGDTNRETPYSAVTRGRVGAPPSRGASSTHARTLSLSLCLTLARARARARVRQSESESVRACVLLAPREGGAPTRPRVTAEYGVSRLVSPLPPTTAKTKSVCCPAMPPRRQHSHAPKCCWAAGATRIIRVVHVAEVSLRALRALAHTCGPLVAQQFSRACTRRRARRVVALVACRAL